MSATLPLERLEASVEARVVDPAVDTRAAWPRLAEWLVEAHPALERFENPTMFELNDGRSRDVGAGTYLHKFTNARMRQEGAPPKTELWRERWSRRLLPGVLQREAGALLEGGAAVLGGSRRRGDGLEEPQGPGRGRAGFDLPAVAVAAPGQELLGLADEDQGHARPLLHPRRRPLRPLGVLPGCSGDSSLPRLVLLHS